MNNQNKRKTNQRWPSTYKENPELIRLAKSKAYAEKQKTPTRNTQITIQEYTAEGRKNGLPYVFFISLTKTFIKHRTLASPQGEDWSYSDSVTDHMYFLLEDFAEDEKEDIRERKASDTKYYIFKQS